MEDESGDVFGFGAYLAYVLFLLMLIGCWVAFILNLDAVTSW